MNTPSVHDAFLTAVIHRLEERSLVFHCHDRDVEIPEPFLTVEFQNVVAHFFEHADGPCVLFEIEEVELNWILQESRSHFERGLNYGWPYSDLKTLDQLAGRLEQEAIRGYQISSSCGLDGFVLASSCTITASAIAHHSPQ